MPPMTDGERAADVDNPRGYYEWEAIKQIGKKPELLDDEAVEGRAIKCISMLLPQMPAQHEYKVIFMTRPIAEVVASQQAMATPARDEGRQTGLRATRTRTARAPRRSAQMGRRPRRTSSGSKSIIPRSCAIRSRRSRSSSSFSARRRLPNESGDGRSDLSDAPPEEGLTLHVATPLVRELIPTPPRPALRRPISIGRPLREDSPCRRRQSRRQLPSAGRE